MLSFFPRKCCSILLEFFIKWKVTLNYRGLINQFCTISAYFFFNELLLFSQEQRLRDSLRIGSDDDLLQDKTITIVHGSNMVDIVYVNFVSGSVNIAREWTDALMRLTHNLLAINASPMAFLEKQ